MSFSIVFAASPSAVYPKIVELCNHTAQRSSHHGCAEDGNLKRPHPPIIDGDKWVDWWLVVDWIWGRRHLTRDVPRYKLAKARQNTCTDQPWWPPSSHGRQGAPPLASRHRTISRHATKQVYRLGVVHPFLMLKSLF